MTKQTLIKDCIYRFISVPELCLAFMDTREFQRMRHIKQLGVVHLVYPSAVHTRLEHSLGVMHMAGEMVDTLRSTGVVIYDREKELIQLAGLLHDIGHVAWSHLLDNKLVERGHPCHEERSVELLKDLNGRLNLLTLSEVETVSRMIRGSPPQGGRRSFIYEIVSNSTCGIDVDRLDYLQRDSYHTGIQGFQPDYLIKCSRVSEDGHLSFLHKARDEVESMYKARAHMFRTVYRHKTVIKAEQTLIWMISQFQPIGEFVDRLYETWKTLDDCELTVCLRMFPDYTRMYTREWVAEEEDEDGLDHSHRSQDEISKVRFV